ncbi:DUF6458 family protein [Cryobacterium sp. GrIS_2_6]|uniref:DUF6458 family protein n=1 Tax=Cryobacterium sp. GrIS_2_6 TaxID=3162785 RepID=UPI002E0CC72D|nr:membrane protein DedA with SNARE-associated domain [Cryobacterium psychrotolerans]
MSFVWGIIMYVVGIIVVWVLPAPDGVDLHMIGYVIMSIGALTIVYALVRIAGGRRAARRRLRSGTQDDPPRRATDI